VNKDAEEVRLDLGFALGGEKLSERYQLLQTRFCGLHVRYPQTQRQFRLYLREKMPYYLLTQLQAQCLLTQE
jgi:hypothetical protein